MNDTKSNWRRIVPFFVDQWIVGHSELKKIISNTGWLAFDKVINIFAGLLIGAWVARYLGPQQYGLFNYAIAFIALFMPIAGLGLKDILIRNIVRQPEDKERLLGTAFFLQLASGFFVLVLSIIVASYMRADDVLVRTLIAILSVSFVLQSFNNTLTYWFDSQIKSKYVVWARNVSLVIISLVKIFLIISQAELKMFAWASLVEIALFSIGLTILYKNIGEHIINWRGSFLMAENLLRDSWPLIFSGLAIVIYMKIDQIMIGNMIGDEALGIYSVAVRISELWYFIPSAFASSFFPSIVRTRENRTRQFYETRMQAFFDLMAGSAYLIAIPVALVAPFLVNFLFGAEYIEAGAILRVHIWAFVFVSLGVARNQWLMVENMTKFPVLATTLGAIINIGLNLLLIPKYAGLGSAWATLISYAVSAYLSSVFSIKLWPILKQLSLSLLIPFRIHSFWQSLREII